MTAKPTVSERILAAVATAAVVAWCVALLVVALSFSGPTAGHTWAIRVLLLAVGVVGTSGLVRQARLAWHRAVSQPLPGGRGSRWMASQPGWLLAIGCWALYEAPEIGTSLWLSHRTLMSLATLPHIAVLVGSASCACVLALMLRVLWRRQAENTLAPPLA